MPRLAVSRFAVIALALVAMLTACSASGAAPAVTIEDATRAAGATDVATAFRASTPPAPRASSTPDLVTPTPAPEHCADPYLTPLPATPTSGPADTPTTPPELIEATPTATAIRIAHADVVPAPDAPATDALVNDPALEQRIRERLGDAAKHYAVVIEDLGDERGVAINADHVFYAASLFKLEVMYEIFHQRDAGTLNFGERYVATDYYSGFDLGPHVITPCSTVSIGDALAAMMSVSDNVAAVMLQDRAGSGHINDSMAALGLTETRLTEDQSLPATAGDVARLIEAIYRGEGVSAASSEEMLSLMRTEELNDRIPRELPDGTVVAHKTGNWTDATHDAGIVYGRRSTYVMVLMSDLGFDSDASLVEADLAKIAWDYFEGADASADSTATP